MNNSITLNESNAIKGLAIIMVMIHHFEQSIIAISPLIIFKSLGPVACSTFFFLSGYGLSVSKTNKSVHYWITRLAKILIPFILSNIVYLISSSKINNFGDWLQYILGIRLINSHCWFIHVLLLMYIGFAIAAKNKYMRIILPMVAGLLYMIILKAPGTASLLAFPLGVLVASNVTLNNLIGGGKCLRMASSVVFVTSLLFYISNDYLINSKMLLCNFLSLIISTPFAVLVFRDLLSRLKVFEYTGRHSMDYYMMHGLCLNTLICMGNYNHYILFVTYVVCVILVSTLFGILSNGTIKILEI